MDPLVLSNGTEWNGVFESPTAPTSGTKQWVKVLNDNNKLANFECDFKSEKK